MATVHPPEMGGLYLHRLDLPKIIEADTIRVSDDATQYFEALGLVYYDKRDGITIPQLEFHVKFERKTDGWHDQVVVMVYMSEVVSVFIYEGASEATMRVSSAILHPTYHRLAAAQYLIAHPPIEPIEAKDWKPNP